MAKNAQYNAADHISEESAADPYHRPAFAASDRARRLLWNICHALLFLKMRLRPMHLWRSFLLRCFGAKMVSTATFIPGQRYGAPWNLICADSVAAGDGVEIYNPVPMRFGSHAILSQQAYLCGATHDYDDPRFPLLAFEMTVGAYAWICARSSLAPGVNVGEGAVLALGSVATRDLAPWRLCRSPRSKNQRPQANRLRQNRSRRNESFQ